MIESVSAWGRAWTDARTSDRGRVTRSPAPRSSCGTSGLGTPRSWPVFLNESRILGADAALREPTSDDVRDGPEAGTGDVTDPGEAGQVGVGAGTHRLRRVDRQAGTTSPVGQVLQRDRVSRRTAAGEEVEHPGVEGHRLEDPPEQPRRLGRLEEVTDQPLELGDRGVGRPDLGGQPDRAQLLTTPLVQP